MQIAPIFSPRSAGLNRRPMMSSLPSRCRNLVPISDCIATAPASDIEPRAISCKRECELGQRRTATADFFGIAHAEEAEVGEFLEQRTRILLRFVQRGRPCGRNAFRPQKRAKVSRICCWSLVSSKFMVVVFMACAATRGLGCPDSLHVPRAEKKRRALLLYLRESDTRYPGRDAPVPLNRQRGHGGQNRSGPVGHSAPRK
jgi:hypothetical protein